MNIFAVLDSDNEDGPVQPAAAKKKETPAASAPAPAKGAAAAAPAKGAADKTSKPNAAGAAKGRGKRFHCQIALEMSS
jgi:hypothetical protein